MTLLTITVPMNNKLPIGLLIRETKATMKANSRALVLEVVTATGQPLSQSLLEDHGINHYLVLPWIIGRLQEILLRNGWGHYATGAGMVTEYSLRIDRSGASTNFSFLIGICDRHLVDDLFIMMAPTNQTA